MFFIFSGVCITLEILLYIIIVHYVKNRSLFL